MERLNKLAAMAKKNACDGVLITEGENLCYATGFVGLEGMVFITAAGKGWCFTDSRYIEAAEAAVEPTAVIKKQLLQTKTLLTSKAHTQVHLFLLQQLRCAIIASTAFSMRSCAPSGLREPLRIMEI